tara:strand:- start:714 stop:1250 length:537 start_codon:yes stop_codon:yes gene_type:complete
MKKILLTLALLVSFSSFGQSSNDKELAKTYVELADNLSEQADYSGAISYYSKAIEIRPNWHYPYFMRGNNKMDIKDYYGAISDFTKTIDIFPNLNVYAYRGYAKYVINDYYGAIFDCTEALKLAVDYQYDFAFYIRAISKKEIGDINGACQDIKKAQNASLNNEEGEDYSDSVAEICK